MKIRDEIARKYWMQAAIEETCRQFLEQGYAVETDARLGEHQADLVARRGKQIIVSQFKSASWAPGKDKAVAALREYVIKHLKAQFQLVWAAPPAERVIEIEGLEEQLCEHLMDSLPSELDELSTHTQIEAVSDVDVSSIILRSDTTEVHGTALVEVQLIYGSDSDREDDGGAESSDSFPFRFVLELDGDRKIGKVEELAVDTSDFYE